MNIKIITKRSLLFYVLSLIWSPVVFSKEISVKDIDSLLSDEILYSNLSFYRNPVYDDFHERLTPYYWKKTPEGFDEKAMKVITSFDVRRAMLESRINRYYVEQRGSIFAVMLYANQSLRQNAEDHLKIARYLGGVRQIKLDEYESDQKNEFRKREDLLFLNVSIKEYRRALIDVTADRLRDLKRNLREEQFNSFTNDYVKIANLSELETINFKECIIPHAEYLRLREELDRKKSVKK